MVLKRTPAQALNDILQEAGSQAKLGAILGCSQMAVCKMVRKGRISVPYVIAAEFAFGVSRHELRPDIYPLPDRQPANRTNRKRSQAPVLSGEAA